MTDWVCFAKTVFPLLRRRRRDERRRARRGRWRDLLRQVRLFSRSLCASHWPPPNVMLRRLGVGRRNISPSPARAGPPAHPLPPAGRLLVSHDPDNLSARCRSPRPQRAARRNHSLGSGSSPGPIACHGLPAYCIRPAPEGCPPKTLLSTYPGPPGQPFVTSGTLWSFRDSADRRFSAPGAPARRAPRRAGHDRCQAAAPARAVAPASGRLCRSHPASGAPLVAR